MFTQPRKRLAAAVAVLGLLAIGGQASFGASPSGSTYVVRPGDSLWRISIEYHVTVSQLAAANDMVASDVLLIGRHLTIPSPPAASAGLVAPPRVIYTARNFCAVFTPQSGPRGVLPALLVDTPSRLALRADFVRWAGWYGVSPALVEAIAWQESGWQAGVVSSAGAVGIGQILPSTAQFVVGDLIGQQLDSYSANDNIRMSAAFLAWLQRQEGGNLCRTIAAYYEGPRNMTRLGVLTVTEPYVASVEALLPEFQ